MSSWREMIVADLRPWSGRACVAFMALPLIALAVVADAANAVQRADSTSMSIEDVLSVPGVGDFVASSTGAIVWVERTRGASNLYVARPPSYKAERLTSNVDDDGVEISIADISADGEGLLYFRGGLPNGARETPNPLHLAEPTERALWMLSLRTGKQTRLEGGPGSSVNVAAFSPNGSLLVYARGNEVWSRDIKSPADARLLFTVRGSVRSLLWSPTGAHLAFVSDRSIYDRGKYAFIGTFDLASRAVTYMAPGLGVDQSPVWSADGRRIAFVRFGFEPRTWRFSDHREGAPFSIVVADARTGNGGSVWTSSAGYGGRFHGFGASGDSGLGGGNNLFWLSDGTLVFPSEKTGWRLLYSLAPNGTTAQLLTPGRMEIEGASLSRDRSTLLYWANSERDMHRLHLYVMSISSGMKPRQITSGDGIEWDAVLSADGRSVLHRQAGASVPERLVVLQNMTREIQLSSASRLADSLSAKPATAELVSFAADDGLQIPAVLYRPRAVTAKSSAPAIVYAHGGSRDKVYPVWRGRPALFRYFVSRGYFLLCVNYRSGIGYGLDFREPRSYGGRGAGDVQDFVAAARYLETNVAEIDPARLAIYGHSYGGHIVSNVLARSDVYAAGVDSAGVGDWVVEMETDSGEALQFNIPQRLELERLAFESSAISRIDQWGGEPVLFLHGDDDNQAALQQTLELYLALQRRGKTVDALILPGEAHSLLLHRNWLASMRKIESFFDQRLGKH